MKVFNVYFNMVNICNQIRYRLFYSVAELTATIHFHMQQCNVEANNVCHIIKDTFCKYVKNYLVQLSTLGYKMQPVMKVHIKIEQTS